MQNKKLFTIFMALALALVLGSATALAKEQEESNKGVNGAEHRSAVSTFVQKILNVADREQNGIGQQVREFARQQEESKDKVADAIDKVQNRNKIKTFLIGTDYKNIGQLRSEMVKTRNQIEQLKRSLDNATNAENKTELENQIQNLEQEQKKIDDFLKANEKKFSLFGWFVKLFSK